MPTTATNPVFRAIEVVVLLAGMFVAGVVMLFTHALVSNAVMFASAVLAVIARLF